MAINLFGRAPSFENVAFCFRLDSKSSRFEKSLELPELHATCSASLLPPLLLLVTVNLFVNYFYNIFSSRCNFLILFAFAIKNNNGSSQAAAAAAAVVVVVVIVNHGNYSNKQHAWPIGAYTLSLSNKRRVTGQLQVKVGRQVGQR